VPLFIKDGNIVLPRGTVAGHVAIVGETVTEIGPHAKAPAGATVIDAGGCFVLPGVIDAHNHPVYGDRLETMSRSAVAGGMTTLLSFFAATAAGAPPVEQLRAFIEEAERTAIADFGIHFSVNEAFHPERDLRAALDAGVSSFKQFMTHPRREAMRSDDQLLGFFERCAAEGGLAMIHAENAAVVDRLRARFEAEGRRTGRDYAASRPNLSESEAVYRACTLAGVAGVPLYVVHLSARESLEALRWHRARADAPPLYAETATHYLNLTEDDYDRLGGLAKISPPLRTAADRDALWAAVADGFVDTLSTDGSGQTRAGKAAGGDDYFQVAFGIPGVQQLLVLAYDEGVVRRGLPMERLVEVLCERPARIFGIFPKKGTLAPGSDADLVVFDPKRPLTITAKDERGNSDYSLYEGRTVAGSPRVVIGRGEVLMRDGELLATPGRARFLHRGRHSPVDAARVLGTRPSPPRVH
jgi:dihydropyrimidinase